MLLRSTVEILVIEGLKHWRLGEKNSTNMWENKSDGEITMVMGGRNIRDRR